MGPLPLGFFNLRGAVFADVGAVWNDDSGLPLQRGDPRDGQPHVAGLLLLARRRRAVVLRLPAAQARRRLALLPRSLGVGALALLARRPNSSVNRADERVHLSAPSARPRGLVNTVLHTDLNDPQLAAVTHGDGPLLVLAGAGSGKTRVLMRASPGCSRSGRAARTASSPSPSPTRRRARCASASSAGRRAAARALWVGTFHATCVRLLRRRPPRAGLPPAFTIYDREDQLAVLKRALVDADVVGRRRSRRRSSARISDGKNALVTPRACCAPRSATSTAASARIYAAYQQALAGRARRLRRPDRARRCACSRTTPRSARALRRPLPARAGRRVPGHQPRAVPAGRGVLPRRTATCSRWATTTRASTAGAAPTSPNVLDFERRVPGRRGHPPGAELPLDGQHPARPRTR